MKIVFLLGRGLIQSSSLLQRAQQGGVLGALMAFPFQKLSEPHTPVQKQDHSLAATEVPAHPYDLVQEK